MYLNSSNQKRLKNNTIRASVQKLSRSVILYACAKLYENVVEKNIAGLLWNTQISNKSKRLAFFGGYKCTNVKFLRISYMKNYL